MLFEGGAAHDAVEAPELPGLDRRQVHDDVGQGGLLEARRHHVHGGDGIARVVQHGADQAEVGSDLEHRIDLEAIEHPDLEELLADALLRVVAQPLALERLRVDAAGRRRLGGLGRHGAYAGTR